MVKTGIGRSYFVTAIGFMIAKRVRGNPCSVEYGMLEFDLVKAPKRPPATKYI